MGEGAPRPEVVAWLDEHAEVGDLVMTACADWVSWLIRWGTGGTSSHVAVVIDGRRVVEAYDKASTLRDDDGGVYVLTFEQFAARGELRRLELRRPTAETFDPDRLIEVAAHVVDHSPPFASFASILQAGLGLTATRTGTRLPRRLAAWVDRQAVLASDGADRVHCAELATRLYAASGAIPVFDRPRLAVFMAALDGHALDSIDGHEPRTAWSEPPPRRRPVATLLRWIGLARWAAETSRRRKRRPRRADVADLVHPVDLQTSPSLRTIGVFSVER